MLTTKIDILLDYLGQHKRVELTLLAKDLDWNLKALEKVAQSLDRLGLIQLHYPLNVLAKPWVSLRRQPVSTPPVPIPAGKQLEAYRVNSMGGHVWADIRILYSSQERRYRYFAYPPEASVATWLYLELLKDEISHRLPLESREKEKTESPEDLRARHAVINALLRDTLQPDPETLETLCGLLIKDMYGLGDLEILIGDPWLEEIVVNSAQQSMAVYHRKHGWLRTNLSPGDETTIENYSSQIARKVGKQISLLNPILDAHLLSGDRVNATIYPISTIGNTITLRLFSRSPWTIPRFIQKPTSALTIEMGAMLWQALHYEMNLMVGGGTASGKTSLLNSILAFIPPFQRIVTIEDTRELSLPSFQWNWVPLVTRSPNPEGLGEVTMLDLVVNSLRMRPDRIVMGEVRRKKEAEVLFEAMHTGHSVYATFHADTSQQLLKRLTEPPIDVPKAQAEDIHLIAIQYRDRRRNLRRLSEIVEVVPGPSGPELNYIYVWKARGDTFQTVQRPRRYLEQLNLHTGMTEKEIDQDQQRKIDVLQWMMDNELQDIEQVGAVMKLYYGDEAALLDSISKKLKPDRVLEEILPEPPRPLPSPAAPPGSLPLSVPEAPLKKKGK